MIRLLDILYGSVQAVKRFAYLGQKYLPLVVQKKRRPFPPVEKLGVQLFFQPLDGDTERRGG